jgi:hypothetical protein
MAKVEKRLKKWLENPPTETPVDQVKAVLERYFAGQYETKSGSHIVVRHDRLKGAPDFGPEGDFVIPVKRGQKVKGVYLKRLARAIQLAEEAGSNADEEGS